MKKIIGKALPILLVLAAVLILLPGKSGQTGNPGPTQPAATAPSLPTQPAPPQTTAPAAAQPRTVEEVLAEKWLDETALSFCVYESALQEHADTTGMGRGADAFALAGLCDEQKMNPVAAFWLLAQEGLYQTAEDASGFLSVPAFDPPAGGQKTYANTNEGARTLLTDLLKTAAEISDGMDLEEKLLGSDGAVDASQVHEAPGDCRYAYFVYYGDRSAYFLCFYLRGEADIADVEFQLLKLRYAAGEQAALEQMDQHADRQAAALMTAAELLLTGRSRANQGRVPFAYELEGYGASIARFDLTGSVESGSLTNYRIRK